MYQARYPGTLVRLAAVVVITALSSPLASAQGNGCNSNDPSAPCFANVSDILQGRRQLLPVEDLVVTSFDSGSGSVNNLVLQTTDSSIGTRVPYPILDDATAVTTGVGRMFNLPRDVIFTITGPPGGINVRDQNPNGAVTQGFPFPRIPRAMTMADFTGDGYADVAVLAADSPGSTSGLLQIITANDVNNLDAGLFVSNGVGPLFINFNINLSITAGDFNGDGKAEVAIAQPAPLNGGEVLIYLFEVVTNQNGTIEALQQVASLTFGVKGVSEVALTAGDYDGVSNATTGLPNDELVIAYLGANLAMNSIAVVPDSANPNTYQLVVKGDTTLVTGGDLNAIAGLASGRLDWFGATEQIVVAFNSQAEGFANVFTFDSELNFQLGRGSTSFFGSAFPLQAMALGNYAQTLGPNDPPNLEIALLVEKDLGGDFSSLQLSINQVDPSNDSPLNSLADVPIETYSNNLGFCNQTFHVASATSAAQSKALEEGATRGGLAIDHVAVPSGSVLLHQPVMIRASHRSEGPRFDSVLTLFYDGNPEEGGSLFDQEIIPRINDSFVAPALYRPGTCGPHQIFVRAIPTDGTAEPATGMATVQVTADLVAEFASLARAINAVDLPRGIEQSLFAKVEAAGKALQKGHTGAAHHLLEALRHEIGALRGKKIPQKTAADWVEEIDLILGCII